MGKGSKGYSTGSGRKWLIGFGLVALVAIIVVVILLCIPPNTYNMVQTLDRTTRTSFLVEDRETEALDEFKANLKKKSLDRFENEINSMTSNANALTKVLKFYNNNIIFASNNKNLKNQYKPIKNNLNSAKNKQKNMLDILETANEKYLNSPDQLRNAMVDFRREYVKWLDSYKKAIRALSKAYTGSMGNTLENNLASKNILNMVNDYISIILEDFKKIESTNKKNDNTRYDYESTHVSEKIYSFSRLCSNKLNSNTEIKGYYFLTSYQTKHEEIAKFNEIYKQENFEKVIASIDGEGTFTFSQSEADTANVLEKVKNLLGGN